MELSRSTLGRLLRLADAKPAPEIRRKYCRSCGSLIPNEAAYCPNCGASQELQAVTPEAATPKGELTEVVSKERRRIRLALFLISLAVFVTAFFLGSATPLSPQEANSIAKEFMNIYGASPSATFILRNNLTLCLLFLIPAFGTAFMAYVGYSSGIVLSAIAIASPSSPDGLILALLTLTFPWAWMEFAAYGLASSEGIMVILSLISRTLRREAKTFLIILAVSAGLLLLGAIIEMMAINTVATV